MTLCEGNIVVKVDVNDVPITGELSRRFKVVWVSHSPDYYQPKGITIAVLETIE